MHVEVELRFSRPCISHHCAAGICGTHVQHYSLKTPFVARKSSPWPLQKHETARNLFTWLGVRHHHAKVSTANDLQDPRPASSDLLRVAGACHALATFKIHRVRYLSAATKLMATSVETHPYRAHRTATLWHGESRRGAVLSSLGPYQDLLC